MSQDALSTGLELVRKAIQFDTEKNFNSAIQHYNLSLNYFDLVLKDPRQQDKWGIVQQKVFEYQTRRDELAKILGITQNQPQMPENESLTNVLERAFQLVDRSKMEELNNNKEQQLNLLSQAVGLFVIVFNKETDLQMKRDVENYIQEYSLKIERVKQELSNRNMNFQPNIQTYHPQQYPPQNIQQYPPQQYPPQNIPQNYPLQPNNNIQPSNINQPNQSIQPSPTKFFGSQKEMMPFETNGRKNFPPRDGEIFLSAKVDRTLFIIGEDIKIHINCNNFSPKTVYSLKIYLKMNEDHYRYSVSKDQSICNSESKNINPLIFTAGSVFPLQKGLKFRGDVFYSLNWVGGILPTKRDQGVLIREYELVISAVVKKAYNLKIRIPITLRENSN